MRLALCLLLAVAAPARADMVADGIAGADALAAQGETTAAWEALKRIEAEARRDPGTSVRLDLGYARVYLAAGDLPQAEALAAGAVRATEQAPGPERVEALLRLAQAVDRQGRAAEAQPLYEAALRLAASVPAPPRLTAEAGYGQALILLAAGDALAVTRGEEVLRETEGVLPLADWAWLHFSVSRALANLGQPDTAAEHNAELLAKVAASPEIAPADLAHYRGYQGIFLIDAGEDAAARPLLEDWFAQLMAGDAADADLYAVGQRLVVADRLAMDLSPALARLDRLIARLDPLPEGFERILAYMLRERGHVRGELGDEAAARADLQRAVETLRLVLPETAPEVQRFRAALDGPVGDQDAGALTDPAAETTLREVLAGRWLPVQHLMRLRYEAGDDTPGFWINQQLFAALMGDWPTAQVALDELTLVYLDPDRSPFPEPERRRLLARVFLLDGYVRTVATTIDLRSDEALAIRERLDATVADLAPDEARLSLAVRAIWDRRLDEGDRAAALLDEWAALPPPDAGAGPWVLLAEMAGLGEALGSAGLTPALEERASAAIALAQSRGLPAMAAVLRLGWLTTSAGRSATDEGIAAVAAALRDLAALFPAGHVAVVAGMAQMATLRELRGDLPGALDLLAQAAAEYRGPGSIPDPGTLAWLLSRQAQLRDRMGQADLALAMSAEAVAALEPGVTGSSLAVDTVLAHARLLAAAGRLDEALALLDQWGALVPLDRLPDRQADVELLRGRILAWAGRLDEADSALARAGTALSRLRGSHPGLAAPLGLQRALLDWRRGDLRAAYDRSAAAARLFLDDAEAQGAAEVADVAEAARGYVLLQAWLGWQYSRSLGGR